MNKFILDLWHDLRSRRLWPVALVLVVALVAVPVVLKKSPHSDAAPLPTNTGTPPDQKAVVVASTTTVTDSSNLRVFSSKNPFKPNLPKAKAASTGTTGPTTSSTPASSGSSGSSGSGSSGGGSGSGGTDTGGSTPKTPTKTAYVYTVNVKFGKRDATRTHHNVQKLDVLPNARTPLIVFMGVTSDGDTAVFLVDTSLKASGEGDCKPSPDVCSFLYLKLDPQSDTEDLLAENPDGTGTEYTLKLLDINKLAVSKADDASAKQSKQQAADARRLRNTPGTPFHFLFTLPQLPDEVSG